MDWQNHGALGIHDLITGSDRLLASRQGLDVGAVGGEAGGHLVPPGHAPVAGEVRLRQGLVAKTEAATQAGGGQQHPPATSPRPPNVPVCGVVYERDGVCVRANETARASGATRCAGIDVVGTCASPMLGPRVIVYDV